MKIISIDTEYNRRKQVLALSIHDGTTGMLFTERKEMEAAIHRYKDCTWVAHHAKADCLAILTTFGYLHRDWWCTMIADQNINKGLGKAIKGGVLTAKMAPYTCVLQESPFSLAGNCQRYLGITLEKTLQTSFLDMEPGQPLTEEQKAYAIGDTEHLLPLREKQMQYVLERGLETVLTVIDFPCIPIFAKKEYKGVKILVDAHRQTIESWKAQKQELEDKLYAFLTQKLDEVPVINFGSPKQLQKTYEAMGWPLPTGDTVSGYSFSDGALEGFLSFSIPEDCREFTAIYRQLVEVNKLLSTYGESFLQQARDGRMHSDYSIAYADTGRVTSSNVNLNNIPKSGPMRSIFVPDEGYVFIDSDHSGQETALAADYSQEPLLVQAVRDGFDMHSYLASESFSLVFGRPVTITNTDTYLEVDNKKYHMKKELRHIQKNCTFTKFYGGGPEKVLLYLGRYIRAHNPPEKAKEIAVAISKRLDKLLPVLNKYLMQQVAFAKKNGYNVGSIMGRRRYYENPKGVFGDSMNFSIQNSGAEAIKIAEIKIDRWIRNKAIELGLQPDTLDEFKVGWIAMQVYDQVVLCVNKQFEDEAFTVVDTAMKDALQIFLTTLTAAADTKKATSWG